MLSAPVWHVAGAVTIVYRAPGTPGSIHQGAMRERFGEYNAIVGVGLNRYQRGLGQPPDFGGRAAQDLVSL